MTNGGGGPPGGPPGSGPPGSMMGRPGGSMGGAAGGGPAAANPQNIQRVRRKASGQPDGILVGFRRMKALECHAKNWIFKLKRIDNLRQSCSLKDREKLKGETELV